MENTAEEKKMTMADLKELTVGIVESHVNTLGLVPLKDLKESVHAELDAYVDKALRPQFEKLVDKLSNLPGEKGRADVGVNDDSQLKGLHKYGGYDYLSNFAKDVYRADKPGMDPSPKFHKWMGDVKAYREAIVMDKAAGDGQELGDPELGGYLVPPQYSLTLLEKGMENSNFINKCTKVPMQRNMIRMPFVQDFSHASFLNGAMMAYWGDEKTSKTSSKMKFGRITLDLNKLFILIYSTDELLEDSPISMEPLLTTKSSQVIGWKLDEALIRGTGAGQPKGVLNSKAIITVNKETNQVADTIVWQNLAKMFSQVHPTSMSSASWVGNNSIFPQLMGLNMAVGTGGVPIYLPANGFSGKPFSTLLGMQLQFSEHCSAVGTIGDLMLIDWSEYLVGMKRGRGSGIQFATSIHLKFDYDQTAFRYVMRIDGQPWWPSAFSPKRGLDTSPFIKLQSRD